MNTLIRRTGTFFLQLGIDPRRIFASLIFIPAYLKGIVQLKQSIKHSRANQFKLNWLPILSDRHMASGVARGHYFHQDLWAARHIYAKQPDRHVDVGSRIDGFIAHLLVFREVEVLDIRKITSSVGGLHFHQADLMQPISFSFESADSVSCLHALEHFGLGRYGDPINFDGWITGLQNLATLLRDGGRLYLSVPIGEQAIEYNAQRIFEPQTILNAAKSMGLTLIEFSYVDDKGDFHQNCRTEDSTGCRFGCGCFLFERHL
jgi:hypothetical protein